MTNSYDDVNLPKHPSSMEGRQLIYFYNTDILLQVEDVNVKFGDLQKLQSSNWDLSTIQPKTKVIKVYTTISSKFSTLKMTLEHI